MARKYIYGFVLGAANYFLMSYGVSAQGVSLPQGTGLPSGNLTTVISNFTYWILGIFGFLAIISFLISGIMYFLAAGDDKQEEKAKKQMTWSIIGVVIGLVGLVIIYAVNSILGGTTRF